MKYEITKHETRDYYYIWDNEANAQVCDPDGEPLRFDTEAEAIEYIANDDETAAELQRIYDDIAAERDISYSDCVFLQAHQADIKQLYPNDPLLWQWANIPESEWNGAGKNE